MAIPPNGTEASEQRFCRGDAPSAEASNISRILPATLISPEVLEPIGRELGVADGVLNVLVAEILGYRAHRWQTYSRMHAAACEDAVRKASWRPCRASG